MIGMSAVGAFVVDDAALRPWLLPALSLLPLGASALLLAARRLDRRAGGRPAAWLGGLAALATLVLAGTATAVVVQQGSGTPRLVVDVPWIPALGARFHLGLDGVSAPLVLLTSALGVLTCLHLAWRHPAVAAAAPVTDTRRLVSCVLAVVGAANATFTALDLVLFFVAFEAVLVPMWFVIAHWGDDARPRTATEPGGEDSRRDAANRFVLYTATGSALMLLGFLLVVLRTGSADLVLLANDPSSLPGGTLSQATQVTAALLIVAGLAVKAPMFPFHTWLPPAHTVAPTVGSVLLAGVLLKLGTYGLVRVALPVLPDGMAVLAPWLGGFAVVGILWAGLVCLVETDLKRLVAFSSVAHMGFVLLGVAAMDRTGLQGALYANVAHGVVTALLFLVVGAVKDRFHGVGLNELRTATGGEGLRDRLPRLGWLLALGAVAGLGLPGLAVFWGELLAVAGAWNSVALGGAARPLAVSAGLGTAIAAAYWLRVLRLLWQGTATPEQLAESRPDLVPDEHDAEDDVAPAVDVRRLDVTAPELVTAAPLVLATVVLGLVPGPLLALTATAAAALLPAAGLLAGGAP